MSGHKNNKKITDLTKKDLKSPGVVKIVINENKTLKESLKETQDELEKMREEKFEQEKKNVVLEERQKTFFWIELFKFLSIGGVGFSINYFVSGNKTLALAFGIPSVIIFITMLIFSRK